MPVEAQPLIDALLPIIGPAGVAVLAFVLWLWAEARQDARALRREIQAAHDLARDAVGNLKEILERWDGHRDVLTAIQTLARVQEALRDLHRD